MAKSKFALKLGPISLLFWPKISTSLWDPLGCSDVSQIFFGSSLGATEWDKTVAEIIHTTFLFLGHPKAIRPDGDNVPWKTTCFETICPGDLMHEETTCPKTQFAQRQCTHGEKRALEDPEENMPQRQ